MYIRKVKSIEYFTDAVITLYLGKSNTVLCKYTFVARTILALSRQL